MKRKMLTAAVSGMLLLSNLSFRSPYSKGAFYIVIDKSDYELNVFDDEGWLIAYPAVFGNKDQGDKMMEGDRKTPNGTFRIVSKRVHEKWDRFMMLDYPTQENVARFNERKARGVIPSTARIGGAIGIHGTWPREDFAVDYYQNWTQGCISLKNVHIEQVFAMLPVGTKVTIRQ